MSGRVGNLNQKQEQILEKFREDVKDILREDQIRDDHFLLKWLRARDFDLKKSEKMIRHSMEWRRQIGADTILDDYQIPEVIQKYYTGGMCGFDNEGCPVWIDPFGHIDLKGLCYSARKIDIIKSKVHVIETLLVVMNEQTEKLGKKIDQIVLIFDIDQFGMKHLWKPGVDVFNELITMFEDHYPETLKVSYCINSPSIFPVAYKLVRPFLSDNTAKKIRVYGRKGWKECLLNEIDAEELPVFWGGTQVDEDGNPKCTNKICFGGEVPKSYYLHDRLQVNDGLTTVTVNRNATLQIECNVIEPNSAIRWHFFTDENDIRYGLILLSRTDKEDIKGIRPLIPFQRVNSHLVPEDGMVYCKIPGIYGFCFDNSYSWLRNKKLHYSIEVLLPDSMSNCSSELSLSNHGTGNAPEEMDSLL
ncbi:SEC14-like protein 2 [Tubulanus polymorphus]|uniref:SEC14-like protein 2 n=1 Tax=Tubulanus polymorphus TaxID=672921 RepID=UPI003DA308FF